MHQVFFSFNTTVFLFHQKCSYLKLSGSGAGSPTISCLSLLVMLVSITDQSAEIQIAVVLARASQC